MQIISVDTTAAGHTASAFGASGSAVRERAPAQHRWIDVSPRGSETASERFPITRRPVRTWRPSETTRIAQTHETEHATIVNTSLTHKDYNESSDNPVWAKLAFSSMATNESPALWPGSGTALSRRDRLNLTAIIKQISELEAGWAGNGSCTPSEGVLYDIKAALSLVSPGLRSPAIEIDDDGSVALLWAGLTNSFALTFYGNGKIVGTLSPFSPRYAPWRLDVTNSEEISSRLSSHELASLLS